jgi:hypothetical protein
MHIKRIAVSLGIVVFFSGCVSLSDYRSLKSEFEQYKTESKGKQDELENKVNTFVKAYSPDLHNELDTNLEVSAQYKDRIQKILGDMESVSRQIQDLALSSRNDSLIVSENMKTSIAENVVNEFHQLKYNWDKIVYDMNQSVAASRDAAARAQVSAIQAAEKSGAAQKAADIAVTTSQNVANQTPGGPDFKNRLDRIEADIRKIQMMLNPGKDNLSLEVIYNLCKDLNKRVGELEKSIKGIPIENSTKQ